MTDLTLVYITPYISSLLWKLILQLCYANLFYITYKTHCGVLVVFNGQEVVMLVQVKNQFSYKTKLLVWIGTNLMLGVFKVPKTNVVV